MRAYGQIVLLLLLLASTTTALGQRGEGQPRRRRAPDKVHEGDVAPDFTLRSPDGKREVTLSEFRGSRPVALVFGSYT